MKIHALALFFGLAHGAALSRRAVYGEPTFTVFRDTNTFASGGGSTSTCQAFVCHPGTSFIGGNCIKNGNGAKCNFSGCAIGDKCTTHWNGVDWTFKITALDDLRVSGMHVHFHEKDKHIKVKDIKARCKDASDNYFYGAGENSIQGVQCELFDIRKE